MCRRKEAQGEPTPTAPTAAVVGDRPSFVVYFLFMDTGFPIWLSSLERKMHAWALVPYAGPWLSLVITTNTKYARRHSSGGLARARGPQRRPGNRSRRGFGRPGPGVRARPMDPGLHFLLGKTDTVPIDFMAHIGNAR